MILKVTKWAAFALYLHTQLTKMIKYSIWLVWLLLGGLSLAAQSPLQASPAVHPPTTIAGIKTELEKSPNPILYTKQVLKKRFKIDTITVTRTRTDNSLTMTLAYNREEKKSIWSFGRKAEAGSPAGIEQGAQSLLSYRADLYRHLHIPLPGCRFAQ